MKNLGVWSTIFFGAILFITPSHANEWGVLGGINFANTSIKTEPGDGPVATSSNAGFIGGFSFKTSLTILTLEADALFVKKVVTEGVLSTGSNALEVPAFVRFTFFPFFNAGLGAYYSVGLGDIQRGVTTLSYGAAGRNKSNFGLNASLQMELPIAPRISLIGDLRYIFGLTEESAFANQSVKTRELQFLAGVSYEY